MPAAARSKLCSSVSASVRIIVVDIVIFMDIMEM